MKYSLAADGDPISPNLSLDGHRPGPFGSLPNNSRHNSPKVVRLTIATTLSCECSGRVPARSQSWAAGDGFERLAALLFEVGFNRSRQRTRFAFLRASTWATARLFDYPFYERRSQSLASTLWCRALYIFIPGIELFSIPWSSTIATPQTFAGSVSNG
jgi:hypothetical protein